MGAKAWLVILGIGVASFICMGMMTKFVVDSNPDLQAMIQFKSAFAEEFESQGVQSVSVRKLPRRAGYHLLLTCSEAPAGATQEVLDVKVADYFLEKFKRKTPVPTLRVSFARKASLACAPPPPYHEKDIGLKALRREKAATRLRLVLAETLQEKLQCRLIHCDPSQAEGRVEVEVPAGRVGDEQSWAELATQVRQLTRAKFRYRRMQVVLSAPATALPPSTDPAATDPAATDPAATDPTLSEAPASGLAATPATPPVGTGPGGQAAAQAAVPFYEVFFDARGRRTQPGR